MRISSILVITVLALVGVHAVAFAEEKSVAEEILDVLRTSGHISPAEHARLRELARSEELRRTQVADVAARGSSDLRVFWKKGVRFETDDGRFKLKLGGRLMNDWAIVDENSDARVAFGEIGSGTEFRRARLFLSGKIYDSVYFKAQYDFSDGVPEFKDTFVRLLHLPYVGSLSIGKFKEPFQLDELTSSKYSTFMERSILTVFAPSRQTGAMIHRTFRDERMTLALGGFRSTDDFGKGFGDDSLYQVTGRITGVPIYRDDGRQLLHLGTAFSHQYRNNDTLGYDTEPEAHLLPTFVDTGTLTSVDGVDLWNGELAWVRGPLSLQAEYTRVRVDSSANMDPEFSGYYLFGSWFLTGENRVYELDVAEFGRVSPHSDFQGAGHGYGAWELAARYSHLDLSDDGVPTIGGRRQLDGVTVGLNWYLNPNTRMMFNWVLGRNAEAERAKVYQARLQVDF